MKYQRSIIVFSLSAAVLLLYWPVFQYGFVSYDDIAYVRDNPWIRDGLTASSVKWSFTTMYSGNWYPLTWISHMLDIELFGFNAGFHHLVNVLLHLVNSLLLFFVFQAMTGARWKSFVLAILFALHPQHVESVAWISERKDVFSTFFWILGLFAYFRYVKRPGLGRYLSIAGIFVMGLLTKPMVVTFPFVLLLVDVWPFQRIIARNIHPGKSDHSDITAIPLWKALLEKLPLIALSGVFSVTTYIAQAKGGAVTPLEGLSLTGRLGSAFVAYATYVWKTIYPFSLAVIYPHSGNGYAPLALFLSIILVAAITVASLVNLKKAPFFAMGWFWFVGTLVPVIGIVQVGKQYMADRYMYIPHIGLFIVFVWGIDALTAGWSRRAVWLKASAALVFAGMMIVSRMQIEHWRDTSALFEHALRVTKNNWAAAYFLGLEKQQLGSSGEAITFYSESVRILPQFFEARLALGNALLKEKRVDEAILQYTEAWRLRPGDSALSFNLGLAYSRKGDVANAETYLRKTLQLKKDHVKAHASLGILLHHRKKFEEALGHLEASLALDPSDARAHFLVADISRRQGAVEKAVRHYREALRIQPDMPEAKAGLEDLLR